jgi:hypothetical protein
MVSDDKVRRETKLWVPQEYTSQYTLRADPASSCAIHLNTPKTQNLLEIGPRNLLVT